MLKPKKLKRKNLFSVQVYSLLILEEFRLNLRFQQIAYICLINNHSKLEIYQNFTGLNHEKNGRKKIVEQPFHVFVFSMIIH
jgi:hypothetical protein